ncbi:MAG: polyketide synthase [Planctomycetes bacterium GWF2_41_51]|nr:MAG: polyketide synthase [Planctomycetes bacterium GWF2_41_51]HBG28751.1 type III polyketide synthase [Phycisphaerales bacterium]
MKINHYIASIATASPPYVFRQDEIKDFMLKHYSVKLNMRNRDILIKVFNHPSMQKRNFAFENLEVLLNETPDEKIARFTEWAIKLSTEAVQSAIAKAGLNVKDISALIVNTCTGYLCPGISTYLIDSLGLNGDARVYDMVGSGCGGAIPNLELCCGLLKESPEGAVVSVSVEICSCTYQMGDDLSLIFSNALFGDGAAAAVIWNRPEGLEIVSSRSRYATQYREDIRFIYKNGQLHNQLSSRLPKLAARTAAKTTNELLEPKGLTVEDIEYWVMHSGGERVINEIKSEIGLNEKQITATRNVLAQWGNVSSPTVWFVLNELQKESLAKDKWLVMLAFGAGLAAHGMLLKT